MQPRSCCEASEVVFRGKAVLVVLSVSCVSNSRSWFSIKEVRRSISPFQVDQKSFSSQTIVAGFLLTNVLFPAFLATALNHPQCSLTAVVR